MDKTTFIAGKSLEGRPIHCDIFGSGDETIFILAAIHGEEPASGRLAVAFAAHLEEHPEILAGRRVVMVAEANPDGLASGTRANANGVDLNRNFPAANRVDGSGGGDTALSEPESRAIARLLEEYRPARIVALHGHLGCMDYDGPARSLARAMSEACGLEVRRLGSQPGSMGSYAGCDLGIPVVTLELTETDARRGAQALWRRYGKALLVALEGARLDLRESHGSSWSHSS